MERYRDIEGLGKVKRLIVGLGRIGESEDDELAYAYHAANNRGEPYDRKRCSRAYMSVAYGYYQRHHVERAVTLVLKAVGIRPHGRLASWIARAACAFMNFRTGRSGSPDAPAAA